MRLTIDGEQFLVDLYNRFADGQSDEEIKAWWESIQPADLGDNEKFQPTSVQMQNLREDFQGAIQRNRAGKALQVKEWFKNNPHLPQPSCKLLQLIWRTFNR